MHTAWNLFLGILMFACVGAVGAVAVLALGYWDRKVGGQTNKSERKRAEDRKRYLN
jgi:hypothetical protein